MSGRRRDHAVRSRWRASPAAEASRGREVTEGNWKRSDTGQKEVMDAGASGCKERGGKSPLAEEGGMGWGEGWGER